MGLTQAQLAERLRVSRGTVAAWEIGKHFPQRYQGAVEEVLGINLDEDDDERGFISPRLRKIIREELDPEDQRRVIGLLEGTLVIVPPEDAPAPQAHRA